MEMLPRLDLSGPEAELAGRVRAFSRRLGTASVALVTGGFADPVVDAEALGEWALPLAGLPVPLLGAVTGGVGARGLALLLCCDVAFVAPGSAIEGDWHALPGLPALAQRRLGAPAARRLCLLAGDALDVLAEAGLALLDADPLARAQEAAGRLGPQGPRLKRALRAAEELPFAEALAFDLAFHLPGDPAR